jgi:FAD synthase
VSVPKSLVNSVPLKYSHDVDLNTSTAPETISAELTVYPNPVSDVLHINYTASKNTLIGIDIYDLNGRLLKSASKQEKMGSNTFNIDVKDNAIFSTGTYICRIQFDNQPIKTIKFNVIKNN